MANGVDVPQILIVDDEEVIREVLSDFLAMDGFAVHTAADGAEALVELSRRRYDLVLSDLKMPNMGGLELLEAIGKHSPSTVTIIMTGFGTVETAITAMKKGAYDYIMKPFKMEEVVHTVRRGLEKRKLVAENLRLKETLSLYKVTEAIAASLSLDEVIETLTDAAVQEVGADLVSVILDDGAGDFFERCRHPGRRVRDGLVPGYTDDASLGVLSISRIVEHLNSERRLRVHNEDAVLFYDDAPAGPKVASLVAVRLHTGKRTFGYLVVCSYTAQEEFDEGQRKLLSLVADRAAAAIDNARLYEDLKSSVAQTIRGLASAIDKMDRYTAGHSARVAAYAELLAIKLGLPEEQVEIVRQAALMHDVGKIGCVINLNKPGILSEREYDAFKQHPEFGKDILEPIEFLAPLVPGVRFHHERWDGTGYPLGLKAQDIPLIARIISVADVYDAMTSNRAYRRALPHAATMSELDRCSGSQFDPDITSEFAEAIEAQRETKRGDGERIPD